MLRPAKLTPLQVQSVEGSRGERVQVAKSDRKSSNPAFKLVRVFKWIVSA